MSQTSTFNFDWTTGSATWAETDWKASGCSAITLSARHCYFNQVRSRYYDHRNFRQLNKVKPIFTKHRFIVASTALQHKLWAAQHANYWCWATSSPVVTWDAVCTACVLNSSLEHCGKTHRCPSYCSENDRIQYAYTCQDGTIVLLWCDIFHIWFLVRNNPTPCRFIVSHSPRGHT